MKNRIQNLTLTLISMSLLSVSLSAIETTPVEYKYDNEVGKTLYKKCSACHGDKGQNKALGKSDVIGLISEKELYISLKGYKEGKINKHNMGPLMKGQLITTTDNEMKTLATYISKLQK